MADEPIRIRRQQRTKFRNAPRTPRAETLAVKFVIAADILEGLQVKPLRKGVKAPMIIRSSTAAGVRSFDGKLHIERGQPESRGQPLPDVAIVPYGTARRKRQNTIGEDHGRKD